MPKIDDRVESARHVALLKTAMQFELFDVADIYRKRIRATESELLKKSSATQLLDAVDEVISVLVRELLEAWQEVDADDVAILIVELDKLP
jgi:hypothetical protein